MLVGTFKAESHRGCERTIGKECRPFSRQRKMTLTELFILFRMFTIQFSLPLGIASTGIQTEPSHFWLIYCMYVPFYLLYTVNKHHDKEFIHNSSQDDFFLIVL